MEQVVEKLCKSPLFSGIEAVEIDALLKKVHYQIKKYKSDEVIFFSGDECRLLKILLSGSVRGEMIDASGRILKIEDILPLRPLAVAFLFGKTNQYPVTVSANEESVLISFPKEAVILLMQLNVKFLTNFMNAVSNRAQFISSKLKFLSFQGLKGKLAHFLLELDRDQKGKVVLPQSREELAELFGVARPSLSRTISELNNEGVIAVDGKNIEIVNRNALISILG